MATKSEFASFQMEKAAIRELPHKIGVHCKLKDLKRRPIDFDGNFLRFHEGMYEIGREESLWKAKCLINKWSEVNPIQISGFSLMKNVRNHSIITLENYYEESGQARIVLSWVDGSLTAWLKNGGYKKAFKTGIQMRGSVQTQAFRRIIIDTCKGLQHLLSNCIYPSAIKESDLFLCNEKVKGEGHLLKMLVCHADRLSIVADQGKRKSKLWADVRNIFHEISNHAEKLSAAAKHFIDYISTGRVEKLDGYPDIWSFEKKTCYLFSLMSAEKSKIHPLLQNTEQFAWPPNKELIRQLLQYDCQRCYVTSDPYDYLRLCRNVIKHWTKYSNNVWLLKHSCPTVNHFLQMLEDWSPGLWCKLYNVVGWPEEH